MKQLINVLILLASSFYFSSCDKTSTTITENYSFSTIDKVSVQCACDANIHYGTNQEVTLTGSEHILENVDIYVDGTTLIIKMKPEIGPNVDVVAEITIPMVEFVEATGSGNLWIDAFSNLNDLTLNISGSGNIRTGSLDLGQDKLTAEISGSGTIEVDGVAESSYIEVAGSGDYEGFDLSVDYSNIDISGSGNVEVSVNNDLDVDITGTGSVRYKGQPNLNKTISGSGNVMNAN